ncbi:hypothetical protein H5410_001362 [Solanum commersonii]|uniref:Uncharacterized protein n=1 Tax=Solanum commersonii TaxID=4109 RepID=A0A9J6AYH9_SOLCO|nr:hypothetical protein H5410_001362 [Solanum commersonii]
MNIFINNNNKFNKKKVVFIMGGRAGKMAYICWRCHPFSRINNQLGQNASEIEPDSNTSRRYLNESPLST